MKFFVCSIILSAIPLIVLNPFLNFCNIDAPVYKEAVDYSIPLFTGLIKSVFSNGLAAILHAEGDIKRAIYAMTLGITLNATLNPVFIYLLHMESVGAAVSTIFTSFISEIMIFYWILIKKDTYINLNTENIIKF